VGSNDPANSIKVITVNIPTAYLVCLLCQDISSNIGDILTNSGECRQSKNDPVTNNKKMKQILQNMSTGETALSDVPVPKLGNADLLVKTTCSLISSGTERMLVEFGKANMLAKARQQPEKVKMVLEKVKTDVQVLNSFHFYFCFLKKYQTDLLFRTSNDLCLNKLGTFS